MNARAKAPKPQTATLDALVDPMRDALVKLPGAELRAALREIDKLTTSNCGWWLWMCRHLLRQAISEWLIDRLARVPCKACDVPDAARLFSDGLLMCMHCNAQRRPSEDEIAALDTEADSRWVKR